MGRLRLPHPSSSATFGLERDGHYKAYIFNENIQREDAPSHTMGLPATVRPGDER